MDQGYDAKMDIPSEVAEISRAEARLANAIGSVVYGMDELQTRLERVLRPAETHGADTEEEANAKLMEVRPVTTPQTDFLDAQASRLEYETNRITDILRRLGL